MNETNKERKNNYPNEAGFTLVEIMVVVVIMGMLATLVTISIPTVLHNQKVKAARQNIARLQNAVDMYYVEIGKYPQTLKDLVSAKSKGGIKLKIIKRVPRDPWDNDFVFKLPGQHGEDYSIISYGADGTEGGDEKNRDITSWNLDGEGDS